jgi:hypothetical protein
LGEFLPFGRILPFGRMVTLGCVLKITEVTQIFGLLFSTLPAKYFCYDFDKKIVWATFWATFSQADLVTLLTRGQFSILPLR